MNDTLSAAHGRAGHNSAAAVVRFRLKLFNSLAARLGAGVDATERELPAGATVGELLGSLGLARAEVYLVLVNGRDLSPGVPGAPVRTDYRIRDGDVVALSGPVPYSWGYGSPVV